MRSSRKKKRKARSSPQVNGSVNGDVVVKEDSKEVRDLKCLVEAFSLVSLAEVSSAYREAEGDPNKAAEILGDLLLNGDDLRAGSSTSSSERFFESTSEDPTTSSNLSSSSSDRFFESDVVQTPVNYKGFRDSRQRRVVASAGTVSSVLGKDYVRSSPLDRDKQYNYSKWKGHGVISDGSVGNEEAEQFLFSMLGDGSELSMAVVRDVFSSSLKTALVPGSQITAENGDLGSEVAASDALLNLSASSYDQSNYGIRGNHNESYSVDGIVGRGQLQGMMSESTLDLFGKDREILQSSARNRRDYSEVLRSPNKQSQSRPATSTTEPSLPQVVLESLFNIPQSSEAKPDSMNWKNVVKKIESFGHRTASHPTGAAELQENTEYAEGEEYHVFREAAKCHWEKMRSYHQKAATAFSRGQKDYAAYLSEQGRVENKRAREADEKASRKIFEARNKGIKNVITIDLHGQHVEQAIRAVKVHLVFMMHTSSVQLLRVITGCGVGKGTVKQSVIRLAEKAGAEWREEENQGVVAIKLVGQRECDFLESDSDPE
ncbi:Smr protein/MutS2 C-terminal [Macleaya cordata]|uniref:Smr protein/MutS2 C-terminal n=1 Tax=Macleaya cordata TaxID=56857 RepID=A0A200PWU9_MACCD|nr:Smr protein/MutS2 C-terminal [Macleaya cordata]